MRFGWVRKLLRSAVLILCGLALATARSEAGEDAVSLPTPAKRPMIGVKPSPGRPDTIIMTFSGKIRAPLADEIAKAFESHKATTKRILLTLNSGGGSVKEGKRVIELLTRIKATHQLDTFVKAGGRCGSMCVFLYAQGHKRYAASASLWLFHEVSFTDKKTNNIYKLDRAKWIELIDAYLAPAGVSPVWLDDLKKHAFATDYWRTGDALLREKSGLIHKATSDEVKRVVVPKGAQPAAGTAGQ